MDLYQVVFWGKSSWN